MSTKSAPSVALALALVALASACGSWIKSPGKPGGTPSPAPAPSSISFRLVGQAGAAAYPVIDATGSGAGTFKVLEATSTVDELRLALAEDAAAGLVVPGPFQADLLTGALEPAASLPEPEPGAYKRLEMPLSGAALRLHGKLTTNSGRARDLTVVFDDADALVLAAGGQAATGIDVVSGESSDVLVELPLATLFDFSASAAGGAAGAGVSLDGVDGWPAVLDGSVTGDAKIVRDAIKANLGRALRFGRDGDGDGALAPGEVLSAVAAPTGASYYVSPVDRAGSGTRDDPFGLRDLISTPATPGRALAALQPGDALTFLAGDYHLTGATDGDAWSRQLLSPFVSGAAGRPITLQADAGARVRIFEDAGGQPVFGTTTPRLDHVRFIGFVVSPGSNDAFHISGMQHEIAYNEVIGVRFETNDNHDGVRLDDAQSVWIHHNDLHGVTGPNRNSACIKIYGSTSVTIEDNHVHDCTAGLVEADAGDLGDGGDRLTFRRNWIAGNTEAFVGNDGGTSTALYYLYDNVIDGTLDLNTLNDGSQIYNNLFRPTAGGDGRIVAVGAWQSVRRQSLWNNLTLGGGQPLVAYEVSEIDFSKGQASSPLAYMDDNVYDAAPSYSFHGVSYTLAQMRAQGLERGAQVVSGGSAIYEDLKSFVLKKPWVTAGRYGNEVGPRAPVRLLLDAGRYGPGGR
jgi:hypothetical protein